jgi:PAS domain S-box-containing protein
MNWLTGILAERNLMPHGYCLVWDPALIWLHVTSDAIIALAYFSIPVALLYFISRRADVAFSWVFALFAAFIVLCGTTHLFEIWTLWHPDYALQGLVKAATALTSIVTAIMLWRIMPAALAVPSQTQLRAVNADLSREVLEKTAAVQALAREKEFSDLIINNTSDGIATLDPDGRVGVWNPAMARMMGRPAEAALGRNVFDLTPELRTSVVGEAIRDALAGVDRALEDHQFDGLRGMWFDARYSPFRDSQGAVIGVLAVIRDVTPRHEMEGALRQAQKMEAIGQLTGGIAHDFNNFLTSIIGNLDLMALKIADGPAVIERLRAAALQGALRAAGLTRQLLAFSRRQMLQPKAIDANALVSGMSDMIQRTIGERIRVILDLEPGIWPVSTDANQLESALLNLAINARDACPDGGELVFRTKNTVVDASESPDPDVAPGSYVVLSVSDTGVGMTPEVVARAFDPFFTTKGVGKGSGLGLSQVYGFVKQSGGHVTLSSALGVGTTVALYLPRERHHEDNDQEDSPSTETAKTGERILVVEDEPLVREVSTQILESLGYRVVAAANATEAMALVEGETHFDMIVTDVGLPGINGVQLVDMILQRRPGLKVVFVTGYGQNAIIDSANLPAGVGLLNKPFNTSSLGAKVHEILDK